MLRRAILHPLRWLLLLEHLLFLVKLCLRGDVVALHRVLRHPSPLLLVNLLQLQHPLRNIAAADLHDVGDGAKHRLVFLRKQRDSGSFASRASRSSHTMHIVDATLR